ncbi:hypothetical protein IWW45_007239 [Coemansia sp. RSA 485]|nr:hypothetical protein IWW45_007239 [Coemansia sp. RSA 485]
MDIENNNAHSGSPLRFKETQPRSQIDNEFDKPASKDAMKALCVLEDNAYDLSPTVMSFVSKRLNEIQGVYSNAFSRMMSKQQSGTAPESVQPFFKKQAPVGLQLQTLPEPNANTETLHSSPPMHVGTANDISPLTNSVAMVASTIGMPNALGTEATNTMAAQARAAVNAFTAATGSTTEGLAHAWQTTQIVHAPMFSSPQVARFPNQNIQPPLFVAASDNLSHLSAGRNFLKHHHRHSLDSSQMSFKLDCFQPMQTSQENASQRLHMHSSASVAGLSTLSEAMESPSANTGVSSVGSGTTFNRHFSVSVPNAHMATHAAFGNAMGAAGAMYPLQQTVVTSPDVVGSTNMAITPDSIMPLVSPFGNASSPITDISMMTSSVATSSNWPNPGDIATIISGSGSASNHNNITNNSDQDGTIANMLSTQFPPSF